MDTVILIAAIGSGLIAGLFLAFSTAVMPALGRLPAGQGRAAMRHINVVIQNPLFLLLFLGTAVLGGVAVFGGHVVGGLLYVVGTFVLTMVVNVPMNNRLERGDDSYWPTYLKQWTVWNHVRTLAALGATVMLLI